MGIVRFLNTVCKLHDRAMFSRTLIFTWIIIAQIASRSDSFSMEARKNGFESGHSYEGVLGVPVVDVR